MEVSEIICGDLEGKMGNNLANEHFEIGQDHYEAIWQ